MLAFACHDVRERVETGVADWDTNCVVTVLQEKLNKYAFAVEASFSPSTKRDFVDFFHVRVLSNLFLLWASAINNYCTVSRE
jgi:hypothetical protein